MKRWDIFCKIVDNYGDIGVCWRLARQLRQEFHISIQLWIDDLQTAKQLIPSLDTQARTQTIDHISIEAWDKETHFSEAAPVVIEAFGCELPETYLVAMRPETVWINLEYLSAENWVSEFHALHSMQGKLTRHFFFPGFTKDTGGLLREHGLLEKRANNDKLQSLLTQLNCEPDHKSIKVSLFSYPHAPIYRLLQAMATASQPTHCFIPATSILPAVLEFFGSPACLPGTTLQKQHLTITVLPFLSQADYDQLLAWCDINFVRGEDSWVRAIWAGNPFIWQPYLQSENTHIAKLDAFLERFYTDCSPAAKSAAYALHHDWSSGEISIADWGDYLNQLPNLKNFHQRRSSELAAMNDLATNLVIFIEKLQKNKL